MKTSIRFDAVTSCPNNCRAFSKNEHDHSKNQKSKKKSLTNQLAFATLVSIIPTLSNSFLLFLIIYWLSEGNCSHHGVILSLLDLD